MTIGREASCDIPLVNESNLSRLHCFIFRANGYYYIQDNQSVNGVVCNGQYVTQDVMRPGQVYVLGLCSIVMEDVPQPQGYGAYGQAPQQQMYPPQQAYPQQGYSQQPGYPQPYAPQQAPYQQPSGYPPQPGYQQPYTPPQQAYPQQPGYQQPGYPQPYAPQQAPYQQPGYPQQPGYQQPYTPQSPVYPQQPGYQQPFAPVPQSAPAPQPQPFAPVPQSAPAPAPQPMAPIPQSAPAPAPQPMAPMPQSAPAPAPQPMAPMPQSAPAPAPQPVAPMPQAFAPVPPTSVSSQPMPSMAPPATVIPLPPQPQRMVPMPQPPMPGTPMPMPVDIPVPLPQEEDKAQAAPKESKVKPLRKLSNVSVVKPREVKRAVDPAEVARKTVNKQKEFKQRKVIPAGPAPDKTEKPARRLNAVKEKWVDDSLLPSCAPGGVLGLPTQFDIQFKAMATRYPLVADDLMALSVVAAEKCYVCVIHYDSLGTPSLMIPGGYKENTSVFPNVPTRFPKPSGADYELAVEEPFGKDLLVLLACSEPCAWRQAFRLATQSDSPIGRPGDIERRIIDNCRAQMPDLTLQWASATLRLETRASK